jgi:hypothetical protein
MTDLYDVFSMRLRAWKALQLLGRIRNERPELWKLILEFVAQCGQRKAA